MQIGIVGAGAFGTALAMAAARNGVRSVLWTRRLEQERSINKDHLNIQRFPDVPLSSLIRATIDIKELAQCGGVILATPAQTMRSICQLLRFLPVTMPLLITSKGIEQETGKFMLDILEEELDHRRVAILSGPSFAIEIMQGLPTALTLASQDEVSSRIFASALSSPTFRLYHSTDVVSTQVGGALKNILAIAAGIVLGKGLGRNAHAALLSRGLKEMLGVALAKGGQLQTLMGLSGMGDLVLTCSDKKSRNMSLGISLSSGNGFPRSLDGAPLLTEGVFSARSVEKLAKEHGLDLPICTAVHKIVNENQDIGKEIDNLLERELSSSPEIPFF